MAKKTYETWCRTYGVTFRHYNSDNGRFAENNFRQEVSESPHQNISYCVINAHHQNRLAEKRIQDLQELSHTTLINGQQRWLNEITANIWPFPLKMANDVHQSTPSLKDRISPLEKISQVTVRPKILSFHNFGCPVYVLDRKLAAGKSLPKWKECARVGSYLGPSPLYARSVALILSLTTRLDQSNVCSTNVC